jgi:flagellar FliL protein
LSEAAESERKRSGVVPLALVAVLTLVVGGGLGVFVVGPMLAGGGAAAAEQTADHGEEGESGGHGESKGGHGGAPAAEHYSIENLVVNPAGTQGTRFLIVSMTILTDNAQTLSQLTAHDAEIRDTLLQVLASKTIQDLSDLTQRERVKEEMRAAAEAVVKPGKIRRIFLPQFVLQ